MPKSKRNKQISLTKTQSNPLELKKGLIQMVRSNVDQYANIFLFSVDNMRNNKLKEIREQWKNSRFCFGKNKVMAIALGQSPQDEYRSNLHKISGCLKGQCGLLFTNKSPQEVLAWFNSYSEPDFARSGNIASCTVCLDAGPVPEFHHSLEPALRKLGLPTSLKKGVIHLVKDYQVCKEGETLSPESARILKLLGHQMAEFRVCIKCYWSNDGSFVSVKDDAAFGNFAHDEIMEVSEQDENDVGNKNAVTKEQKIELNDADMLKPETNRMKLGNLPKINDENKLGSAEDKNDDIFDNHHIEDDEDMNNDHGQLSPNHDNAEKTICVENQNGKRNRRVKNTINDVQVTGFSKRKTDGDYHEQEGISVKKQKVDVHNCGRNESHENKHSVSSSEKKRKEVDNTTSSERGCENEISVEEINIDDDLVEEGAQSKITDCYTKDEIIPSEKQEIEIIDTVTNENPQVEVDIIKEVSLKDSEVTESSRGTREINAEVGSKEMISSNESEDVMCDQEEVDTIVKTSNPNDSEGNNYKEVECQLDVGKYVGTEGKDAVLNEPTVSENLTGSEFTATEKVESELDDNAESESNSDENEVMDTIQGSAEMNCLKTSVSSHGGKDMTPKIEHSKRSDFVNENNSDNEKDTISEKQDQDMKRRNKNKTFTPKDKPNYTQTDCSESKNEENESPIFRVLRNRAYKVKRKK